MSLPHKPLPTSTLTIEGQTVACRGLSRTEAMHFTTGFTAQAMPDMPIGERADLAEIYLLVKGTGVTEDEAAEWRNTTDSQVVEQVLNEILALSALTKTKDDGETDGPDPQLSTSET